MNNEPVAWCEIKWLDSIKRSGGTITPVFCHARKMFETEIPLYTKDAIDEAFEAGRQQGMRQERAMWELAHSTQEIENGQNEQFR